CLLSNPVSAKKAYENDNIESNIQLVSFPYADINDNKVQVTDADISAKYDELKQQFKQLTETRDIKYVDVQVVASAEDRVALNKSIADFSSQLATAADPSEVIRKSMSFVPYLGIPQTKAAFPSDIAAKLDSMAVGTVSAPVENKEDNTINVIKLIAKQSLADSIQFRAIQVGGDDVLEARRVADSIYTALQGGADFEALAKKYGQTGEKNWLTSAQYQSAPSMDKDTREYIRVLNSAALNATTNLEMTTSNMIIQVLDRKGFTDKYTAAVIKKSIDFSKDTYSAAFNKFSQFVSENQTIEAMEKNAAKYGYKVQERQGVSNAEHNIAGIRSTREAMKWLFDAKKNAVSPLYECGNNDHLLVLALTEITPKGYISKSNAQVAQYLKSEVLKDKKAAQIMEKIKGVKSVAEAQKKGGKVSDVNQITFSAPVFISETGASEPALSGAVAATAQGKFSAAPVKGNAGVYLFQVKSKNTRTQEYKEGVYEMSLKQKAMQYAGNFMQELFAKANVKDNRYLFF
ncbi:MAG: peptidyl-prolyl cis-trans isomerase, partial [Prevotella sp.]|nr:peptidyl-prolyl cis-trans isomerase [Prevotella sp.]